MEIVYLDGQKVNIVEPICSAIGFFDGLHIGHMALVNEVKRVSEQKGYKKALMTFEHYPLYVLGKIKEEKYLTSMNDRISLLEKEGLDYLFIVKFTKEVAALSPEDFINQYLIDLHVKHIVCGFDFRFGKYNAGNTMTLQACQQFNVSVIPEVLYKGEKISSTRIRHVLEQGNIEEMNELLGRKYCVSGEVIKGRRIGHAIGFPTANVDYQSYFLPCHGVYIVKVYVHGQGYMGMCNIGYNPTFTALDKPSLEVNILDFDGDIYHQYMIVEFYCLIRKEKPFASKEELIAQLYEDKQKVREYFKPQDKCPMV